jgi:uncharacterized damage-inducible protein DinB
MATYSVPVLLDLIDQAFKGPAWHGPALVGLLRGVSAETALRRPAAGRHNIWELVLHAAYWKCIARRRITGDGSIEFPRSPADWPAPPSEPSEARWKADRALLKREHDLLRAAVERLSVGELKKRGKGSRWRREAEIIGIVSHDLYHGGQIGLVKRLVGA